MSAELDKPDDALAELAITLGLDVVAGEPRLVVIARVEDEVSRGTGVNPPRVRSSKQADLLEDLGVDVERDLTVRTADAFIRTGHLRGTTDGAPFPNAVQRRPTCPYY